MAYSRTKAWPNSSIKTIKRYRVKFGGGNRERGVWGGSFLTLTVAYIPNLSLLQSPEPFEK